MTALEIALAVAVVLLTGWCVASERGHARRDRTVELWRDEVRELRAAAKRSAQERPDT